MTKLLILQNSKAVENVLLEKVPIDTVWLGNILSSNRTKVFPWLPTLRQSNSKCLNSEPFFWQKLVEVGFLGKISFKKGRFP